jgi:hypothetical protein
VLHAIPTRADRRLGAAEKGADATAHCVQITRFWGQVRQADDSM